MARGVQREEAELQIACLVWVWADSPLIPMLGPHQPLSLGAFKRKGNLQPGNIELLLNQALGRSSTLLESK